MGHEKVWSYIEKVGLSLPAQSDQIVTLPADRSVTLFNLTADSVALKSYCMDAYCGTVDEVIHSYL